MAERHATGHVRECHGDLHLGNIAVLDNAPVVFDGIEFSEGLRRIDVMSEVAFTVMDLEDRGRCDLAFRLCNAYLEITGDYDGLAVLRFYKVHRALVRAMVARLRAEQSSTPSARDALVAEYRAYVDLGRRFAEPPRPALIITHGPSGCGKSSFSQVLLESVGALRLRSDVERKRLHGLKPTDREAAGSPHALYAADATRETYSRMLGLARQPLRGGYSVIVDATFLARWQRQMFRALATECRVPFAILDFDAREATLRRRVQERAARRDDASDADLVVLEQQLRTRQPLAPEELVWTVRFDAEISLDEARAPNRWDALRARIGR